MYLKELSERDYARKIVLKNKAQRYLYMKSWREMLLQSQQIILIIVWNWWVKKNQTLPVLENNAVLGVISIGDVVKSIIEIQKRNNSVFDYISGKNHNKVEIVS
jgi:hypothetical protein